MSVPKNPDPRAARYVELVMAHAPSDARFIELVTQRAEGVTEEDIASALEFNTPEELYRRLAWEGLPVCAWCGAAFVTDEHDCEPARAEKRSAREALYVGMSNMPLDVSAPRLMAELAAVGLSTGEWREAGELTYPAEYETGEARQVRLSNGQILLLVLDAYREEPSKKNFDDQGRLILDANREEAFDDHGQYGRVEVRGMMPRTDRSILAALCVFEGSGLSRAGRTKKNVEPALERIRQRLRGERVPYKSDEDRLQDLARALLRHYRPELDQTTEEGKEMLLDICKRVLEIARNTRQLANYLAFGKPGADTREEIEDAQLAVRAAELSYIEDLSHREIGRLLGLEPSNSDRRKGGHSRVAKLVGDGEDLLLQALGEEGLRKHVATQRARLNKP